MKIYAIKEVSKMFNISSNKLRFYEKKGLIHPKRDPQSDYRQYTEEDLLRIQVILTYRALDIAIEDIRRIIEDLDEDALEDQLFKQLDLVNKRIHKYRHIQNGLTSMMNTYLESSSKERLNKDFLSLGLSVQEEEVQISDWIDEWDFNRSAHAFDQLVSVATDRPVFYENYHALLDKVVDLAIPNLSRDDKILDIGVGTGNLAGQFLSQGFQVVGLDQAMNMLVEAKKKYPTLPLKYGDFLKLPFEDATFDRIVSTYAFHHLKHDEKVYAIREMFRVLKEGGQIVIGDIMYDDSKCPAIIQTDDEYYTDIVALKECSSLENIVFKVYQVDPYLYVITLKKRTQNEYLL